MPRRAFALALGVGILAALTTPLPMAAEGRALSLLKQAYAPPVGVPFPDDNPYSPAKQELGRQLFNEPALSADGSFACATCHNPERGFTDGLRLGRGVPGQELPRHTPTLWNLAWAPALFWDGHADSLEQQARGPIDNPIEMAQPLPQGVAKLAADPAWPQSFATAFPEAPTVDEVNVLAALATYERTLVSPPTRFDRWVGGDRAALTAAEVQGFLLFNGKAGCAACHSGWAFTDHAFHDIGLPGIDPGRGRAIGLPAADHAFKTPGLRELARTAPYMHDGRFATLDQVLDHYAGGIIDRPTLSPDLRRLVLTATERSQLLAFLATLTTETPGPVPVVVAPPPPPELIAATDLVQQRDRQFAPRHVRLTAGQPLTVVNDDTRTHNIRIAEPNLAFDSGAQEPGQKVEVPFPSAGRYHLFCGIHPTMKLTVDVEARAASQ
ncbi:MAG: cytochrome c peroxidase [Geminicoccaceae bacterium]